MELLFNFRQKLKEGKPLVGTIQTLDCPEVTEILVGAGFDWLFVDGEHSALDVKAVTRILQAAGTTCPCIVRPPAGDEIRIKRLLDTGVAGILVPQVKSAAEAEQIVRFCKYPPEGCRSVGLSRAHGYGTSFRDYVDTANRNVAVILQVEHIGAAKDIKKIAALPGIDALLIGPYDLSGSMGQAGQTDHPEVVEQIEHVRSVCLEAGMPLGIFTPNPADVPSLIDKGYTLIAVGIDTMILAQSARGVMKTIKKSS